MSVDGRLVLIDWDTAALAAPERDLWLFGTAASDETERYEQMTGRRVDPTALLLYELRWYLDDVASAVRMFRRPHGALADTDRWFEALPATLAQAAQWLDRLR
jgi:spectinomycin phosphotransferase